MRNAPTATGLAALAACALLPLLARGGPPDEPRSPREEHAAFFATFCLDCHDGDRRKGGLDLESLAFEPRDIATRSAWVRVHDKLRAGDMPPGHRDQPEATERSSVVESIAAALTAAETARYREEGRGPTPSQSNRLASRARGRAGSG